MDKEERYYEGKKVTLAGGVANLVLAVVKLVAGYAGKSEALIADAVHSLSDLLTDVVVLVSLKFSNRPVDEARPYGYGRVETVGTGILGVVLMIVGAGIFWDAIGTVNRGVEYVPTSVALVGALLSIVVKEGMYHYTIRVGKKIHSSSLIANAWHHRSDAMSSLASFAGVGAAMMGWPIFDPLAAIVVTFLIVKVGWTISKDSFMDIIDTSVNEEIREEIVKTALDVDGVYGYHDLKTRKTGSDILVDIHIEVNPWMSVSEAHEIADKVRDCIVDHVAHVADVLVHLDPESEKAAEAFTVEKEKIINEVSAVAAETEGVKSCGDVRCHCLSNNIFVNLTIGLSSEITVKEGRDKVLEIKKKILDIDKIIDVVINVDLSTNSGER